MATALRLEMIWPPDQALIGSGTESVIYGRTYLEQGPFDGGFWIFERLEWNLRQVLTGNYWDPLLGTFVPGLQWWPATQGSAPGEAIQPDPDAVANDLAGFWDFWVTAVGTDLQLDFGVFADGDYVFTIVGEIAKLPNNNRRRTGSATTRFTIDGSRPSIVVNEPQGDIVDPIVTFAGTVGDDRLDTMSWAIRDRELGDHWHDGGGFLESLRHHPLPLQSGAWSFEWRGGAAGSGDYELILVAVDDAQNETELIKPFRTDFGPPVLQVNEPTHGADNLGPMVEFAGVLQARNAGTAYVRMAITDRSNGEGWNFDRGVWGHPDGEYLLRTNRIWDGFSYVWDGVTAGALGGSGKYRAELVSQQQGSFPQRAGNTVTIDFTTADVDFVFPRSQMDQPDAASLANGLLVVTGTAEDPAGLLSVRVALHRLSDGYSWDTAANDFTEPISRQVATLNADGTWSIIYGLIGQPPGEYRVRSLATNVTNEIEPLGQRPVVVFTLT